MNIDHLTQEQKDRIVHVALAYVRQTTVFEIDPSPHYTVLNRIDASHQRMLNVLRKYAQPIKVVRNGK